MPLECPNCKIELEYDKEKWKRICTKCGYTVTWKW